MTVTAALAANLARRDLRRDLVESLPYVLAACAVAFFIASGGLLTSSPEDVIYSVGRALGLVAAVLVLTQMTLVSRVPLVERAFGHDRTAAVHARLGKVAFLTMLAHAGIITLVSAARSGKGIIAQSTSFWDLGWFMVAAQIALGLFFVVAITSLVAVRSRWRYERWHVIHGLVYLGIAAAVPHQFLEGSTFRSGGVAWWFWLILYTVAVGSFLIYRVIRPLIHLRRHQVRVARVTDHGDGTTSIVLEGRELDRLGALPGQFFLWRFLDRDRWTQAHPFSMSQPATANQLRITVKAAGDFTAELGQVKPGTRVLTEGPLGVFSPASRTSTGAVMVAAGVGITPIRAMLDQAQAPCDVIVRVRSRAEAPLLDEVEAIAAARGLTVHLILGPRGAAGWGSHAGETLQGLVPDVARRDVFVCGPPAWAAEVVADARAAGVPASSVHNERFGW